jgi:Protein of unknown function (DUF2480)
MQFMENELILNRVAQSPLLTLDLEEYYDSHERLVFDLKNNLYQELILREKDLRDFVKSHDWTAYQDKNVAILCSTDAVVPVWAFMLVAIQLQPFARKIVFGSLEELEKELFREAISRIDLEKYRNQKVVIKGCSRHPVPVSAYVEISRLLTPLVSALMYGEPCSTVPLMKKKAK